MSGGDSERGGGGGGTEFPTTPVVRVFLRVHILTCTGKLCEVK